MTITVREAFEAVQKALDESSPVADTFGERIWKDRAKDRADRSYLVWSVLPGASWELDSSDEAIRFRIEAVAWDKDDQEGPLVDAMAEVRAALEDHLEDYVYEGHVVTVNAEPPVTTLLESYCRTSMEVEILIE